jgi:hypothetical protein
MTSGGRRGTCPWPAHHWHRHGADGELRAPVYVRKRVQISQADVPRRSYRRGESWATRSSGSLGPPCRPPADARCPWHSGAPANHINRQVGPRSSSASIAHFASLVYLIHPTALGVGGPSGALTSMSPLVLSTSSPFVPSFCRYSSKISLHSDEDHQVLVRIPHFCHERLACGCGLYISRPTDSHIIPDSARRVFFFSATTYLPRQ